MVDLGKYGPFATLRDYLEVALSETTRFVGDMHDYQVGAEELIRWLGNDGLVIVPREPTEAMLDAYWRQTGESKEMRPRTHAYMKRYWSAMIEAEEG